MAAHITTRRVLNVHAFYLFCRMVILLKDSLNLSYFSEIPRLCVFDRKTFFVVPWIDRNVFADCTHRIIINSSLLKSVIVCNAYNDMVISIITF